MGLTADGLAGLNALDLERDALEARIGEIAAVVREPAEVAVLRASVQDLEVRAASADATRIDADLIVRGLADKIYAEETRLYSGKTNNPRELQDLQAEIAALRRQLDERQSDDLAAMEGVEAIVAERDTVARAFKRAERSWRVTGRDAIEERKRARERISGLDGAIAATRAGHDVAAITLYDRVRRGQPRAVARLEARMCGACRTQLPEIDLKRARAGDELVLCPACRRILQA